MMGILTWTAPAGGLAHRRVRLEERKILGARFLEASVARGPKTPEAAVRRRVLAAARRLRKAGVTRAVLPEGFAYGPELERGGLAPVSTLFLRRSLAADLARSALAARGERAGGRLAAAGDRLTGEMARAVTELALGHRYVLLDVPYGGEELASIAAYADMPENIVVIDSVSKRFSACGARVGALISRNRELMSHAMKFCQARLSVATLDQVAAAALYAAPADYFAATREEYKRRRDTVVESLSKIPGVVCKCPEGAFYLMAKLPVDNADDFQMFLLREFDDQGDTVMYAPGGPFYATPGLGEDEIRIAYVLKEEDLARAVEVLGKGIAAYNARQK